MEEKSLSSTIPGFGLSFAVVSVLNGLLVIAKEMNPGLKGWMADFLGHHWVTHGVLVIGTFLVLGWLFSRIRFDETWHGGKMAVLIVAGTVIGGGLTALFFLSHL